MCPPVAVPAHPRILAGRRFLRISGNISPHRVLRVFREIRFYLHKEFRDREIRLYLHKEYVGAILKKIVILLKENWSHMDNFKGAMLMKIVILLKENWSHMDKFSILVYFKIFRDANSWGAMRQEMAILKGGNSVCRGSNFFSGAFILYSERNEQLGAMRRKMAIFKERKRVCRVQIVSGALILYSERNEQLNLKIDCV